MQILPWFISSHECWSILCGFFALICLLHICCISFAIFCLQANLQCIDTGIIFLGRYFHSVTFQRQWTWQAKLEIVIWFISQLFTDLVWCIGLRLKWNDPILKYVSLIAQFHGYISGRGSSFKMVEACKVIYIMVLWGRKFDFFFRGMDSLNTSLFLIRMEIALAKLWGKT